MDEKLNIQDLASLLSQQNGMEKEEIDNFVREFFALIGEALGKDKYVKVKGLGVFKLVEVDARESVNIQTKERFEIPKYTKIAFTPDISLKDTINQPFAIFETVTLNDNTTFEKEKEKLVELLQENALETGEKDENHEEVVSDMAVKIVNESEVTQPVVSDTHMPRMWSWHFLALITVIALCAVLILCIVLFVYR